MVAGAKVGRRRRHRSISDWKLMKANSILILDSCLWRCSKTGLKWTNPDADLCFTAADSKALDGPLGTSQQRSPTQSAPNKIKKTALHHQMTVRVPTAIINRNSGLFFLTGPVHLVATQAHMRRIK